MIEFSEHEKQILSRIGQGAYGRELMDLLRKAKEQLCSLESLERGQDYNAQVEGRLLFKQFADTFVNYLGLQIRPKNIERRENRDYE